ncbi:DoxX family protein [Mycobacterium sp. NPDC003449]
MTRELLAEPAAAPPESPATPWGPVTKIAFRFCFVYFGLFCLMFAQIVFAFTGIAGLWLPQDAVLWQLMALDPVLSWVGRAVFGVDVHLQQNSGSGDQAVIWLLLFCILVVALIATAVWSVIDRRRPDYSRLWAWFLTFVRLCVAGQMLFYGFAKVIPTQMPAPPLTALLQRYGDLSPISVLWLQVGSSYPYEITLGAVEVLAGVLLFVPRTATLGALVGVVSMAQVFLLNMTFDVPVKILSGHLLLMGLLLLVPQTRRLANILVLQRSSEPARQPELFADAGRNRRAAIAQVALGVWILTGCVWSTWQAWGEAGGGRPEPQLYGIWAVREFSVDGTVVPPLTTDPIRWQRMVVDQPGVLTYQRMDGELVTTPAEIGSDTIALSGTDGKALGDFAVARPESEQLRLTGRLDGRAVQISLDQVDPNEFTLRNRGFNWVQEVPYFR